MIDAIIRGTMGEFGSAIIDFYIEHNLIINAIILCYALLITFARRGYQHIKSALKAQLMTQYGVDVSKRGKNWFIKNVKPSEINWKELAGKTWIPLISKKGNPWFQIKTPKNLQKIFTPKNLPEIFQNEG